MLDIEGLSLLRITSVERHVAQWGERYLDAVEVGGSIPPVPTTQRADKSHSYRKGQGITQVSKMTIS